MRNVWLKWVNRRIPPADSQRFEQNNIFILPSGAGLVFALLLLIMLVTGINYQNSLIYLLTFLLGALFVAAMHQTHRNLAGTELTLIRAGEGFVGEEVPFVMRVFSARDDAIAIGLSGDFESPELQSVQAGDANDLTLLVRARMRGRLSLARIRVATRFPFGLLQAWSWMRPVARALVYPRPLAPPHASSDVTAGEDHAESIVGAGFDDAEVRPWRQGDQSQRVLWKRFARTGDMVIADWEGEQGSPHWLDYAAFPGVDQELRLSYLSYLVLERDRDNRLFGLRLPGDIIEPGQGASHRRDCLRALALFNLNGALAERGVVKPSKGGRSTVE